MIARMHLSIDTRIVQQLKHEEFQALCRGMNELFEQHGLIAADNVGFDEESDVETVTIWKDFRWARC